MINQAIKNIEQFKEYSDAVKKIDVSEYDNIGISKCIELLKTYTPSQFYGPQLQNYLSHIFNGEKITKRGQHGDIIIDGEVYEVKIAIREANNFNLLQIRLWQDIDIYIFMLVDTNIGDTVLDFAMGSGTTGEACLINNRNFIGIELDKSYFESSKKRLSKYDLIKF